MPRDGMRRFVEQAKGRAKSDPATMAAALTAFVPALHATGEQATSDAAQLHVAEMTEADTPKLRELCEQATQKLGAIRREESEIAKRLRRLTQARREYDEVLAQFEDELGQ